MLKTDSNDCMTIKIIDDEDGVWHLREHADTGERGFFLVKRASELHDEGWIFFKARWRRRPSMGGDLQGFMAEMGF